MEKKKQTHIIYGFITGLIMAIMNLVIYIANVGFKPGQSWIVNLIFLPFLGGVILNALAYSKANDGFVTFGNVFGSGFKATIIIILVMVVWSVISNMVFPDMKEKALELARTKIQESQNAQKMTDEQIETSIDFIRKHWTTIVVGTSILYNLFFGAVFSLIGAAAAKKKGDNPFNNAQQM